MAVSVSAEKLMAKAMSRSINSQAEHWMKIGKMVEEHPQMTYQEVMQRFIQHAFHDPAS